MKLLTDTENVIGKAYATSLRVRAQTLRSDFIMTKHSRLRAAEDLEALAWLAENMPEVFGKLPKHT